MAAIKDQNNFALKYASEDLRSDKEVVMESVSNNPGTIRYASDDIRAEFYGYEYGLANASDETLSAYGYCLQ